MWSLTGVVRPSEHKRCLVDVWTSLIESLARIITEVAMAGIYAIVAAAVVALVAYVCYQALKHVSPRQL